MKKALLGIAAAALLAFAPAVTAGINPIGLVYAPHDCTTPKIEPHRITLACGDSGALLRKAQWSDWGGEKAKGEAFLAINDCDPNCADGHFITYGVKVKLDKIKEKTCGGQLVDLYRHAHLRFIGEVPPHAGNLTDWKLFCNE
ncbi:MAG: hypothetical protein QOI10_478 [Solirubrobacterales bacterium]|nr:hypothetical protein [Solirubrobacterales bacterium]